MGHHHHHHDHSNGNIRTAFFLNFFFTIIEIIGGLLTNSMAILSDALHDLGDSLSLGLAWFLEKYSKKGHDEKYSFGYRRFSLLAALINSVVLVIGSVFILTEAVPRLLNPESPNAAGMILLAVLGIVVNGAAVVKMKDGESMNAKVISWHLLEDVLGWVAVLIVSIVLFFVDLPILDPLLSIGITLYILYNVIMNLKKTMELFLERVPDGIQLDDIKQRIEQIDNVLSIHHTHLWSLDGEHHAFSTHIIVPDHMQKDDVCTIKSQVNKIIRDIHLDHVTIEIEYESEECSVNQVHHH
ncbi:cobalt transporter [Pontibacillus halophilus JSM 076056 = DSM 19796]|uniref:Cobalt transporter n=1 Tax=Pontibacillus halophilus JSM 076056 = DSM 19796 TaxID=1385510 RepID=A0A0A5GC99_9BACI|nr:cation diffusion facilitator family transporter [Pontibacillus halophilus]KGX88735.1 cobalt transporter [Pontibacillus halophilus JSM 076056 = DSM 19796]